jgi:hypothetical protein
MNTVTQAEIRNLSATKRRSTLACQNSVSDMCLILKRIFGEPCWIRTNDPLLKRQMLCRLS